jgi:hypothetical protein
MGARLSAGRSTASTCSTLCYRATIVHSLSRLRGHLFPRPTSIGPDPSGPPMSSFLRSRVALRRRQPGPAGACRCQTAEWRSDMRSDSRQVISACAQVTSPADPELPCQFDGQGRPRGRKRLCSRRSDHSLSNRFSRWLSDRARRHVRPRSNAKAGKSLTDVGS